MSLADIVKLYNDNVPALGDGLDLTHTEGVLKELDDLSFSLATFTTNPSLGNENANSGISIGSFIAITVLTTATNAVPGTGIVIWLAVTPLINVFFSIGNSWAPEGDYVDDYYTTAQPVPLWCDHRMQRARRGQRHRKPPGYCRALTHYRKTNMRLRPRHSTLLPF